MSLNIGHQCNPWVSFPNPKEKNIQLMMKNIHVFVPLKSLHAISILAANTKMCPPEYTIVMGGKKNGSRQVVFFASCIAGRTSLQPIYNVQGNRMKDGSY